MMYREFDYPMRIVVLSDRREPKDLSSHRAPTGVLFTLSGAGPASRSAPYMTIRRG